MRTRAPVFNCADLFAGRTRRQASLELSKVQRQELKGLVRVGAGKERMAFRARLILQCAAGADNLQVARDLKTTQQTVTFWRKRFLQKGVGGLSDSVRSGRPERIKPVLKDRILSEAARPPAAGRPSRPQ